jgi:N-Acetylglucosaminyltransferase-IV (GnT-IV) conserved region
LISYLRSVCWRDPTSAFFEARRAQASPYSSYRIQQGLNFADLVAEDEEQPSWLGRRRSGSSDKPPDLCIGVSSVSREGAGTSYLKATLGSIQQGLTSQERASLHIVVLLAHVDEYENPDYGQPWLEGMVDTLASYRDDTGRLTVATELEKNETSREEKSKFDYSVVLEECEKTGAEYTLMLEDDVVLMDGWRHRTMDALRVAEAKTRGMGEPTCEY